jgi:hypothetical protein
MEDKDQQIANSVFNLMRRLPPSQITKTLAGVGQLIENEELKQTIFESVDQPLGNSKIKFNKHVYRDCK